MKVRHKYVPKCSEVSDEDVHLVQQFIDTRNRLFILSGAGLSTESGLPDYRSKKVGLYERSNHKPMQHQHFISSEMKRKKYWARSYVGWEQYEKTMPNVCHHKLKELEADNKVLVHVTQNVDGLNIKAGIENIVELHGSMRRVVCLQCKHTIRRRELQNQFQMLNQFWSAEVIDIRPDADALIRDEDIEGFKVPPCKHCGGDLKPDVVFFGDSVPRDVVENLYLQVEQSDGVIVFGSSLFVWSGYRFVKHAHQHGIPILIVNIGDTRADDMCTYKVDSKCSDVLSKIKIGKSL